MLSVNKSDSLNDECGNGGYDSGSAGMCALTFCFEDSVGRVDNSVVCVDNSVGVVHVVGSVFTSNMNRVNW